MAFSVNYILYILFISVKGLEIPGSCKIGQYYDPGSMECQSCPANVSLVVAPDGFGCTCEDHSVPAGVARCRPCNSTEVVSADGKSCVKRRCQNSSGKIVCRKCPGDYISVTQNFDGSPMKEVLCVKCARGYRADGNVCTRCESCACAKNEIAVRGKCVPKRFVNERPKYEETKLHPFALLDVVRNEFFCTQNDLRACRALAHDCVKNLYNTDPAGPCRLWIQPKITQPKGLPPLTVQSTSSDKSPGEITLTRGMDKLTFAAAVHTPMGGVEILEKPNRQAFPCLLPFEVVVGRDYLYDCHVNVSKPDLVHVDDTITPYLYTDGDFKPLPISIYKPNGHTPQKGTWPTTKFTRFFLVDKVLPTRMNVTNTVYLRSLLLRLQIQRDKYQASSLRLRVSIEAHYAMESSRSGNLVTVSLRVQNEMPGAGVHRGMEVWGGVLGALLALYAMVQWRGLVRRGGHQVSLLPLLSGSLADTLYFACLFSTLHALAAEAGTLGMTLPLSNSEERLIKAFVYSSVSLKAIRLAWTNWNQCRYDIFFIDWSEYNPPVKEISIKDKSDNWKSNCLAREWSLMQTTRRAPPGFTVILALVILQLMIPWQTYLPQSRGYKWALATLAWWSAYVIVVTSRWVLDRTAGPPTTALPKVCSGVELSLLVFQEEYYAHYVHGRNNDTDSRSMSGPLSTCRVVCAPQLRLVYKQLSTPGLDGLGESDTKQALLSRFLAAFFERALDGLSWVASERTMLERLLDVELMTREAGNTSALLYDPDVGTPSCFLLTWWGEEWCLGTFDAMLFGAVFLSTEDSRVAGLVTIVIWQVLRQIRTWFGNKNRREKTDTN